MGSTNSTDQPRQIEGPYIDSDGNIREPDYMARNQSINNEVSSTRVSIAIDFGTSNCAVAFSTDSEKSKLIVINQWQDGVKTDGKIPTCILFDEKQNFVAFGNNAITKYKELVWDNQEKEYYYFEKFKMCLYQRKVLLLSFLLSYRVTHIKL